MGIKHQLRKARTHESALRDQVIELDARCEGMRRIILRMLRLRSSLQRDYGRVSYRDFLQATLDDAAKEYDDYTRRFPPGERRNAARAAAHQP